MVANIADPGLADHGVGFKNLPEAIWLRNRVLSQLDRAAQLTDVDARRAALTFVFVGAGFAGIEALGELEELARVAAKAIPQIRREDQRWVMLEAGPRILPELTRRSPSTPPRNCAHGASSCKHQLVSSVPKPGSFTFPTGRRSRPRPLCGLQE